MPIIVLLFIFFWGAPSFGAPITDLVKVPGGSLVPFWIAPIDGKVQPLPVGSFFSMVFPVTNSQFVEFLKVYPEWRKSQVTGLFADSSYLSQFDSDLKLKVGVNPQSPATFVSWFAARAYCDFVKMRMPTVVEWEYVAAASEKKANASQDPEFLNEILEWYSEPRAKDGLSPVGRRRPNNYGLHDLHGLVWEWAADFNSSIVTGEGRADGSLNRDLFCGAGAMSGGNKENYAAFMRFAFRSSLKGKSTAWNLGFRCVK